MGKNAKKLNKKQRIERQIELLKEFVQDKDHYEEKKVGNSWYVKMWNGSGGAGRRGKWQVAVYSDESFKKYKDFSKEIKIIDERKLTPDNSTAVPNALVDKYAHLFNDSERMNAVLDLIQQAYKSGLEIGREEKTKYYEKILDEIYK